MVATEFVHGIVKRNKIVKICIVSIVALMSLISMSGVAEEISRPALSMEHYDLAAKVLVKAVDRQAEHAYKKGGASQLVGSPVKVELIETLRKTENVVMQNMLVPIWAENEGRRHENLDQDAGMVVSTNIVAIACRIYTAEEKWCVVEWVLTDDAWQAYRKQKETGLVEMPYSQHDYDLQQRLDAARQRAELRRQMEDGEITREEYKMRSAPLTEILSRPIEGSTL